MRPAGFNALQVLVVLARFKRQDLIEVRRILLLKDGGVLTGLLNAAFILTIFTDLIDEEQRQHLDAFAEKLLLLFEVRLDCLANLQPTKHGIRHVPARIAHGQRNAIGKTQRPVVGVHVGNHVALVLVQLAGLGVQVVTFRQQTQLPGDPILLPDLHLDPSLRGLVRRNLNRLEVQIGARAGLTLHANSADANLFHQLLVECVQRIQPVNLVVLLLVRGGIAQDEERVELLHRLNRARALHLLGLIQNQNRPVGSNHINRPARLEVVQLFVNPTGILAAGVERLHINDHQVDAGV